MSDDTKEILKEWRKFLTESSLARVHKHIMEHDCAAFSGFRDDLYNSEDCTEKSIIPEEGDTNIARNRQIKAMLLDRSYGITKIDGAWINEFGTPNAKEVKEKSLFCVNLNDDPSFNSVVVELSERYCQDAILLISKGGKDAYLLGTNNHEFPGYGNKVSQGALKMGREAEFMSKVKNRPFTFTVDDDNEELTEELQTYESLGRTARMAVRGMAAEYRKKIKKK